MMNVQRLSGGLLGNAAPLASIVVSLPSFGRFLFPVWPTVINVAAKPNGIVCSSRITRRTLPFKATLNTTKVMLIQMTWATIELFSAGITRHSHAVVLRVIRSTWGILVQPGKHTLLIAKVMVQAFKAAFLMLRWFSAVVTRHNDLLRSGSITTGERAILLLGVIAWRLEHFAAMLARLGHNRSARFAKAGTGTETDNAICPFLDWLSTGLAKFSHSSIIA